MKTMITNKILCGDSWKLAKTLPDESVDCIVTSPPYWGLRDYGVEGQLGLEPTFQEYINKLCDVFDEIKRVLKEEGTCFVNLGDSYNNSSWAKTDKFDKKQYNLNLTEHGRGGQKGYQDKCLCMIPSRFAIEMINRGWILRNELIWWKRNCMPSSASDRFTVDFEKIFFFTKNKQYYFEQQFEPHSVANQLDFEGRKERGVLRWGTGDNAKHYNGEGVENYDKFERNREEFHNPLGRNMRTVWDITTQSFSGAHFACFPEELPERCIKAGCPIGGVVLDPFMGSGTTAIVAKRLGRQCLGFELNQEYIDIAEKRLKGFNAWKELTPEQKRLEVSE